MDETLILHLSDLHFGNGFDDKKWTQITKIFSKKPPDLVIITGDIVNHPLKTSLKSAKAKLDAFKNAISAANGGKNIPLVYIPGNHDTRIYGLVPLSWLSWCALLSIIIPLYILLSGFNDFLQLKWFFIPIALFGFRLFFTGNLKKIFGDSFLSEPIIFKDLNVGIVPLDSSRTRTPGAHGSVHSDIISDLHDIFAVDENKRLFWIAGVHHHALPLPSDNKWEPTMLLKNAGTVLQNLIHYHIPLILHGHKHHQHFSRFFLVDRNGEREISVLSAGTPTHSRAPSRLHSFNTISINRDNLARVEVFEADQGAAFVRTRTYLISSAEVYQARKFKESDDALDTAARRLICNVSIDDFGGAIMSEEFSGLRTKKTINKFEYDFALSCRTGHVFSGKGFADNGPSASSVIGYKDTNSVFANVTFNPSWQCHQVNFNYRLEYRIQNFCALNSVQFDEMYSNSDYRDGVEQINFGVPICIAVEEFLINIKFPSSVSLPEKIWLSQKNNGKEDDFYELQDIELVHIHSASSVFARIPSPKPGAVYQVKWLVKHVEDEISVQSRACEDGLNSVDAEWLNENLSAVREFFSAVCSAADEIFIKKKDNVGNYKFNITVFGYNSESRALEKRFGYGNDRMRGNGFRFGLGLPGLALKARHLVFHDNTLKKRYKSIPQNSLTVLLDDEHHDIEQESEYSVAIPLYCKVDTKVDKFGNVTFGGRPYGVLKVSVEGLDSSTKFFDISNNFSQATFAGAVCELMYSLMESAILSKTPGSQ